MCCRLLLAGSSNSETPSIPWPTRRFIVLDLSARCVIASLLWRAVVARHWSLRLPGDAFGQLEPQRGVRAPLAAVVFSSPWPGEGRASSPGRARERTVSPALGDLTEQS
jgi:hypothetical protein